MPTAPTQQECLEAFFLSNGFTRKECRTVKYRCYTKGELTVWLGSRGACRSGATVTDSIPVAPARVTRYIEEGRNLLKEQS